MNGKIRWAVGLAAIPAMASMACESTTAGGVEMKKDAAAVAPCGADGLIDDCEDQNNQVIVHQGRSGYWYTYVDDAGSTVTPEAGSKGGTFVMAEGGANGSQYAARMTGTVANAGTVYVGMGFSFTDPKEAYDASKYGGIKFYAKKGAGAGGIRIKIADGNTAPEGGRCQECFNDFGANVELTPAWTEYVLPFYLSKQESGWGDTFNQILPNSLYGIQWQTNTPGASFDIWVDDISFVGCDSVSEEPPAGGDAAGVPAVEEPPPATPADPSAPEPAPVPVE